MLVKIYIILMLFIVNCNIIYSQILVKIELSIYAKYKINNLYVYYKNDLLCNVIVSKDDLFHIIIDENVDNIDSVYFCLSTNKDICFYFKDIQLFIENCINDYHIKIWSYKEDYSYRRYIKYRKKNNKSYYFFLLPRKTITVAKDINNNKRKTKNIK
jgi:hypothetical protein